MVVEVTMTRHGPWRHVGMCWVRACLKPPLEGLQEQQYTTDVAYDKNDHN